MLEADKIFAGSVPENYDRHMVPLIFASYAADLARRAAALRPSAVLEIAAGTGAVTRALAPLLPPSATYIATDLNQAMLDYARSRQPAEDRVVWHQADAMALPFQDATFDLACCQFGAMFFPDRPAAYREARRVLRPNGRFLFSVWDRIETNVFADDVTKALATVFPDDPPRFAERTPHGYHDRNHIRDDLARAGFREIEIDTRADVSRAPSAHAVAVAYCQGTPLRGEIEARDPAKLEAATKAVEAALMRKHGNGEIAAKIQAHVILASA